MEEAVRELLEGQRLGVLATSLEGHPYTTLVAFAASDDLRHLVFATTSATRKFANLEADPRVSLLVDSRTGSAADFREAAAVTALGTAVEASAPEREALLPLYLARHPYLREFVASPSCTLLRVAVRRYCLVRRFQEVEELCLEP
ncbi:pyridoxamine 5'-phosphate oxidase family protein [Desulfuromonas sp.]|uniref:pyridoxamine 5'-phosphate oxidase family protein n=1 Tax=Desulfuromonas sp. TaxID=892 RepID=UPI0025BA8B65|nr:pyridoxamine 5'-phosphate oxidase family protein [Desulfuromonas sp.]